MVGRIGISSEFQTSLTWPSQCRSINLSIRKIKHENPSIISLKAKKTEHWSTENPKRNKMPNNPLHLCQIKRDQLVSVTPESNKKSLIEWPSLQIHSHLESHKTKKQKIKLINLLIVDYKKKQLNGFFVRIWDFLTLSWQFSYIRFDLR